MIKHQAYKFDIPIKGIVNIENFHMYAGFGKHASVQIQVLIKEENIEDIHYIEDGEKLTVYEKDERLFCGKIIEVSLRHEKAVYYVNIKAVSYTYEWTLKKVSQSFNDCNLKYIEVFKNILSKYKDAEIIDMVCKDSKIPEFLLQYEESDWSFLERLASHFAAYIIPEYTEEKGRVYIGIPDIKNGVKFEENEYNVEKKLDNYYKMSKTIKVYPQEYISIKIVSDKKLVLGEEVIVGEKQIKVIVTEIEYSLISGEIVKNYKLSRKAGMLKEYNC
jgi:Phage late control gene D protein (GPD).